MRARFAGSVPKDIGSPEANEDKFALSACGGRFAMCDGASESFDSKAWAAIVSATYAVDPEIDDAWVAAAIAEYSHLHDRASMSWSKQAAFERGSFTTLLGVEEDAVHEAVEILAIGDSIALLVSGDDLAGGWPFVDPVRFRESPTLLSTLATENSFLTADGFWTASGKTFNLRGLDDPTLLCMTDALGEWALRQALEGAPAFRELLGITTEEELRSLVERERAAKRMRIDDSTLVVLSFDLERGPDALSIA